MEINPIVSIECEDCGITLIVDSDFLTVFELNGEYTGVTICANCERPLIEEIDEDLVREVAAKGVRVLHWLSNE